MSDGFQTINQTHSWNLPDLISVNTDIRGKANFFGFKSLEFFWNTFLTIGECGQPGVFLVFLHRLETPCGLYIYPHFFTWHFAVTWPTEVVWNSSALSFGVSEGDFTSPKRTASSNGFREERECLWSNTRGSHILATPEECSPHTKTFLFLPKIEFQSNNGHYYDIPFFKQQFPVFTDQFFWIWFCSWCHDHGNPTYTCWTEFHKRLCRLLLQSRLPYLSKYSMVGRNSSIVWKYRVGDWKRGLWVFIMTLLLLINATYGTSM